MNNQVQIFLLFKPSSNQNSIGKGLDPWAPLWLRPWTICTLTVVSRFGASGYLHCLVPSENMR